MEICHDGEWGTVSKTKYASMYGAADAQLQTSRDKRGRTVACISAWPNAAHASALPPPSFTDLRRHLHNSKLRRHLQVGALLLCSSASTYVM